MKILPYIMSPIAKNDMQQCGMLDVWCGAPKAPVLRTSDFRKTNKTEIPHKPLKFETRWNITRIYIGLRTSRISQNLWPSTYFSVGFEMAWFRQTKERNFHVMAWDMKEVAQASLISEFCVMLKQKQRK